MGVDALAPMKPSAVACACVAGAGVGSAQEYPYDQDHPQAGCKADLDDLKRAATIDGYETLPGGEENLRKVRSCGRRSSCLCAGPMFVCRARGERCSECKSRFVHEL